MTPERLFLYRLSTVTGFLRKMVLSNKRVHIDDIKRATGFTNQYLIDLLSLALASDYCDEQLILFCSQIDHDWEPDPTMPVLGKRRVIKLPPLEIIKRLMGDPEGVERIYSLYPGRLEEWFNEAYDEVAKKWLAKIDNDAVNSGVAQKLALKWPPLDLSNLVAPVGIPGPPGP